MSSEKASASAVFSTACFAFSLFFVLFGLFFHPCLVSGSSMEPGYSSGDIVLTRKVADIEQLNIGDVIVFRAPDTGKRFIKRVEGLPGDRIQISGGVLIRNGESVQEDFPKMESEGTEIVVPEGAVYVLGDNRNHSRDSRSFGSVSLENIKGVVTKKIF